MAALVKSLGTAIRTAGQAIDSMGAAMQGKYAYRETCKAPSLSDDVVLSFCYPMWQCCRDAWSRHIMPFFTCSVQA